MKTRAELEALRDTVRALSGADQLRLAAGLLDKGRADVAEPIVRAVADDLAALRLCGLASVGDSKKSPRP